MLEYRFPGLVVPRFTRSDRRETATGRIHAVAANDSSHEIFTRNPRSQK